MSDLHNGTPSKKPIRSVKMKHRILYLDGDPFLNYHLPLTNAFTISELAMEIQRACVEYDRTTTWEAAQYLAKELLDDFRGSSHE